MTGNDLSAYKELYVKTAHDYIDAMQASIVLLTADIVNKGALETLHRSGHSLKSQSMLMGYKNTASLSHYIEVVCRNILESKETMSEKILSEVKEAIGKITESLKNIEDIGKEINFSEAVAN